MRKPNKPEIKHKPVQKGAEARVRAELVPNDFGKGDAVERKRALIKRQKQGHWVN